MIYCNILMKLKKMQLSFTFEPVFAAEIDRCTHSKWKLAPRWGAFAMKKPISYLIAKLLALRWFHLWFISSSRLCSMTASSWLAKEPSNFRPAPFRDENTSRWHSISLCKSWKHARGKSMYKSQCHERRVDEIFRPKKQVVSSAL